MNLLLDTQAFVWLDIDQKKLSEVASRACSDPGNSLWLSVVSAWEMQIKVALGKLTLQHSLAQTIADEQTSNGIQMLPVQLAHVLELQNLPFHHKDPFDRLLIAQTRHEGWEIVSVDPEFRAYGVPIVW
jgi:PIN domain nuclease of toxin-antitoxin system